MSRWTKKKSVGQRKALRKRHQELREVNEKLQADLKYSRRERKATSLQNEELRAELRVSKSLTSTVPDVISVRAHHNQMVDVIDLDCGLSYKIDLRRIMYLMRSPDYPLEIRRAAIEVSRKLAAYCEQKITEELNKFFNIRS